MRLAATLAPILTLPLFTAQLARDATTECQAAMSDIMGGMMIPRTGNADVDFIKGMIPHHQSAVDHARIVLKYGTDPELRKFAESGIAAQEAEISWMTDGLAANAP